MGISHARSATFFALLLLGCEGVIGGGEPLEPNQLDDSMPPRTGSELDGGIGAIPDLGSTPDAGVAPPAPPPDCNPATTPLLPARALRLSAVTINQSVSIPIVDDAAAVSSRGAPVVAERAGVLRVFVDPQPAWQPREIIARLTVNGQARDERRQITGSSSQGSLDSTINFALDPGELAEDSDYSVQLLELDPCGAYAGDAEETRFPSSNDASLGVDANPGAFRIVLVPVRYQVDGSTVEPTVDGSTIERFEDRMRALYPVTDLEISIRQTPLDFDRTLGPDGEGWVDLLSECLSLRVDDGASPNTYYYCAIRPTIDASEFCSQGCIAGLGPVPSASDLINRAAIGLLYENGVGTFVHEIGHTLGLFHAPCGGVSGADPDFPYSDGRIGAPGFDVSAQEILDTEHRDIMSYCGPAWISDYHYALLYERLVAVTAQSAMALKQAANPVAARPVIVEVDGSLTIGNPIRLDAWPEGEELIVQWLDRAGTSRDLPATLVRVSHLPGGIIYVPEMEQAPSAIRVPGYGTAVPRR